MITKRPSTYIEMRWERRDGCKYGQPVEYCNGSRLTHEAISEFKNVFGVSYRDAKKESRAYNDAVNESMFNSGLWKNQESRAKALNKIYEYNLSGKSGTGSTTTPLLPFEIYMMNDGFEMVSFCEMNAINPGFSIVCEKQKDNVLISPKGVKYGRCYQKDDYIICLAFGIKINGRETNFYFTTNKSEHTFQVDNNLENYEKAINGQLKPL